MITDVDYTLRYNIQQQITGWTNLQLKHHFLMVLGAIGELKRTEMSVERVLLRLIPPAQPMSQPSITVSEFPISAHSTTFRELVNALVAVYQEDLRQLRDESKPYLPSVSSLSASMPFETCSSLARILVNR